MSDIICVTNRKLCREDFLIRIERIAKANPRAMILREKDLNEAEYAELFQKVKVICENYGVKLIAHSYYNVAKKEKCGLHLPMQYLCSLNENERTGFESLGASCHSVSEAKTAQELGCSYITAGHIFETDCKKGLAPRGIEFLKSVCESVSVPVYAIGGITPENYISVKSAGACGVCLMSSLMLCESPEALLKQF